MTNGNAVNIRYTPFVLIGKTFIWIARVNQTSKDAYMCDSSTRVALAIAESTAYVQCTYAVLATVSSSSSNRGRGPNRFVGAIIDKSLSRHFLCTVEEGFKLVDADGNRSTRGQGLLIYKGGTVCDRNFGTTAAKAICREMG